MRYRTSVASRVSAAAAFTPVTAGAHHLVEQVVPSQAPSPAKAEALKPGDGLSDDCGVAREHLREDGMRWSSTTRVLSV